MPEVMMNDAHYYLWRYYRCSGFFIEVAFYYSYLGLFLVENSNFLIITKILYYRVSYL